MSYYQILPALVRLQLQDCGVCQTTRKHIKPGLIANSKGMPNGSHQPPDISFFSLRHRKPANQHNHSTSYELIDQSPYDYPAVVAMYDHRQLPDKKSHKLRKPTRPAITDALRTQLLVRVSKQPVCFAKRHHLNKGGRSAHQCARMYTKVHYCALTELLHE